MYPIMHRGKFPVGCDSREACKWQHYFAQAIARLSLHILPSAAHTPIGTCFLAVSTVLTTGALPHSAQPQQQQQLHASDSFFSLTSPLLPAAGLTTFHTVAAGELEHLHLPSPPALRPLPCLAIHPAWFVCLHLSFGSYCLAPIRQSQLVSASQTAPGTSVSAVLQGQQGYRPAQSVPGSAQLSCLPKSTDFPPQLHTSFASLDCLSYLACYHTLRIYHPTPSWWAYPSQPLLPA